MDKITTNIEMNDSVDILNTPLGKTLSVNSEGIKTKRAIRFLTEFESVLRKRVLDAKSALSSMLLQRAEALDILPKNADDLTICGNSESIKSVVLNDEKLTFDIYSANIKYELLKERYETLFGEFK